MKPVIREYFCKADLVLVYANFILSNPSDQDIIDFNTDIINRWSKSALIEIKNKAWKVVYNVRPDIKKALIGTRNRNNG